MVSDRMEYQSVINSNSFCPDYCEFMCSIWMVNTHSLCFVACKGAVDTMALISLAARAPWHILVWNNSLIMIADNHDLRVTPGASLGDIFYLYER